eukprot:1159317-Pelagomonas_calceolata.AAC.1
MVADEWKSACIPQLANRPKTDPPGAWNTRTGPPEKANIPCYVSPFPSPTPAGSAVTDVIQTSAKCLSPNDRVLKISQMPAFTHREVMPQVPVMLCQWHVKVAMVKKLGSCVKLEKDRLDIWGKIVQIMHGRQNVDALATSLLRTCEDAYPAFCRYMEMYWIRNGKLGRSSSSLLLLAVNEAVHSQWADAYRQGVEMAGQSGTQIVESGFFVLKENGVRAKPIRGRKICWLISHLLNEVQRKYDITRLKKSSAKPAYGNQLRCASNFGPKRLLHAPTFATLQFLHAGLALNQKAGLAAKEAIAGANTIPPQSINTDFGTATAFVPSSSSSSIHTVTGLGSGMALCSCPLGFKSVTCKHLVAAVRTFSGATDEQLLQSLGFLKGVDSKL